MGQNPLSILYVVVTPTSETAKLVVHRMQQCRGSRSRVVQYIPADLAFFMHERRRKLVFRRTTRRRSRYTNVNKLGIIGATRPV